MSRKAALGTGSAQGIGFAIAQGLAHAGASVVINGITDEEVNRGVEKKRAELPSAEVRGVVANVATAKGAAALVAAVPTADILINNAGFYSAQDFFESSDDVWLHMYEVNVMSGVRMARAYLEGMAQRGWGRVVFISSEAGLHIPVDMIHYGMTKTANLSVSRGLRPARAKPFSYKKSIKRAKKVVCVVKLIKSTMASCTGACA